MGFFAERFNELHVVCGPGVQPPADDRNHSTLIWNRIYTRVSVSANRPADGEGRIVLVAEENSREAVAFDLNRGPQRVENGRLRAEYDGRRIIISRRGRLNFIKSIDPSQW